MKSLKLILALSLIISAQVTFAQDTDPELKALIQKSFAFFPRLKELEQQVAIGNAREDITRANYRPVVTGNATYSYLNPVSIINIPTGPGTVQEIQTQPYGNQNGNIAVNQLLYDFGRAKHSLGKSKIDILIAQDNLELNKATLASQVAGTYYSIIYLEQSIAVQDSVIQYFTEYKRLIDNKIKRGDALEFDALTAQSNIDQAGNRKVDLQNQLQRQYNLLAYTTGEGNATIVTNTKLDFLLGATSEDSLMSIAKLNNKEILLSKKRIMSAEEDLALNRKNFMPLLNLNGSVGFKNGYQPDISQTRFNYLIGAGLSIPIYNGNRNRSQVKISQSTLLSNQFAASSTESAVKRDMGQALADVQASTDRLKNTESQIAQASRALQLAKSRFRNGTITYVELLNSQTNLHQAVLFKLQYTYQLTLAKVELARLMGITYW
ncbi:MAG: TolC family protein [Cyclobacteriaceae bacterium]|nr:TolC family protein [Cyclobacteriaceae bacterium]